MKETRKTGLLPFFIPHIGCPYICVFCHQPRISGAQHCVTPEVIAHDIATIIGDTPTRDWEVAFYGGSFTAIAPVLQRDLLQPATEAFRKGMIKGIRISTRPDAIDSKIVQDLFQQGVRTIELGVQTMNDRMLDKAKRGHSAEDVKRACQVILEEGMILGIQLLPGLPGETWLTLVHTAVSSARLEPHLCRIYPVIVFSDTELEDMVKAGTYTPLSLEQAIAYSAFLKTYLERHGIQVIRTGLQATDLLDSGVGMVGGPYEPAFGELVVNEQYRLRLEKMLQDHRAAFGSLTTVKVTYPRQMTSKIRGLKNRNVEHFYSSYGKVQWEWKEEGTGLWMHIDGIPYWVDRID